MFVGTSGLWLAGSLMVWFIVFVLAMGRIARPWSEYASYALLWSSFAVLVVAIFSDVGVTSVSAIVAVFFAGMFYLAMRGTRYALGENADETDPSHAL